MVVLDRVGSSWHEDRQQKARTYSVDRIEIRIELCESHFEFVLIATQSHPIYPIHFSLSYSILFKAVWYLSYKENFENIFFFLFSFWRGQSQRVEAWPAAMLLFAVILALSTDPGRALHIKIAPIAYVQPP